MKKAVIRVDSSRAIGSGHLMRCLTLAAQLRAKDYEVHFVCRDLDGNLSRMVEEQGFILHLLSRSTKEYDLKGYAQWLTVPQSVDALETRSVLQLSIENERAPIELLVIDSYAIDIEWEKVLRPTVEKIFVIDCLANRHHDCDILLDQNFYLNKDHRYDGLVPAHCRLLLGPKHALLRAEFYETKKNLRRRDGTVKNILVFYGGIDLTNETMKALKALVGLLRAEWTVDVVVGGSNPHREEVEDFCRRHEQLKFHCQIKNMAELMNQADLSLCAGGTTTWERLFLELPSIVTAVADNQVEICKDCAAAGLIEYLGRAENVDAKMIARAVEDWTVEKFLNFRRSLSNERKNGEN